MSDSRVRCYEGSISSFWRMVRVYSSVRSLAFARSRHGAGPVIRPDDARHHIQRLLLAALDATPDAAFFDFGCDPAHVDPSFIAALDDVVVCI